MRGGKLYSLSVSERDQRLDRYIAERIRNLSRVAVRRLIDDGEIRVDGVARKASYRVRAGEKISVRVPHVEPVAPLAENIPLDILFENQDVIVVSKPAGMVVHPAAGHSSGTLANAILAHWNTLPKQKGYTTRPGIVHRLDRDTSGVMLVAKNDAALERLQAQFKARLVRKSYLALVWGEVSPPNARVDAPLGRDPRHRDKIKVLTRGKVRAAVTVYRTLANLGDYTLLYVETETGRTHQIRVHLAFAGFPVVGDQVYGKKRNSLGLMRQFLHAWKISFDLPRSDKHVELTAPLPRDLILTLERLNFDASSLK